MSKLTERQEELREAMRRLKFGNTRISEYDPTGPTHRPTTQLGMSPSELKNKHAFASTPYDSIRHAHGSWLIDED